MKKIYSVLYLSIHAFLLTYGTLVITVPFTVPPLPYAYNALEPFIDTKTMEIHHDKHHAKYVSELNAAIEKHPELSTKSLEELVKCWPMLAEDIRNAVRNNAGGHLNHSLFWKWMTPRKTQPTGKLLADIAQRFSSLQEFKNQFAQAAQKVFGSGWAWLCLDPQANLVIVTTPNQDNPITNGFTPILGLDVWEHAYYLKYTNKRNEYLDNWWHIVNWTEVEKLYNDVTKNK